MESETRRVIGMVIIGVLVAFLIGVAGVMGWYASEAFAETRDMTSITIPGTIGGLSISSAFVGLVWLMWASFNQ